MSKRNKKIILSVTAGLFLSLGLGYTNCGDKRMTDEIHSTSDTSSLTLLEGTLPAGEYTVKFRDGTRVKFKQ